MPSHIGGQTPLPTEMPPPLISTQIVIEAPLIDQSGMIIIIVTVIVAGIIIFKVLRRKKK